jgi:hypothetical protein
VTDDLTVSKSDLTDFNDAGRSTRDDRIDVSQPTFMRNQNRTFAEQVLNQKVRIETKGAATDIKKGATVSKTALMLAKAGAEDGI